MPEKDTISEHHSPATVESLEAQLRALGVCAGQVLLVHSSLSALGWVVGGAQAVIAALLNVCTDSGTLVMPAQTGANSEPAHWQDPPVPEAWWQTIRDHMPAFNRRLSPTRMMGAIAELFRCVPDVRRSDHPTCSFCAWGRYSHAITAEHRLNSKLGEDSPLARVYDLEGQVLLLGVGHDRNTSLHLSEYRADWPGKRTDRQGAAVQFGEGRQWVQFDDLHLDSDDFATIGAEFDQSGGGVRGTVGQAQAHLMDQRVLVDFGTDWISRNRK